MQVSACALPLVYLLAASHLRKTRKATWEKYKGEHLLAMRGLIAARLKTNDIDKAAGTCLVLSHYTYTPEHLKRSAEVPVKAHNTGKTIFECPEPVSARAATRH
eukprot:6174235-Pleurochrysis_carterae.AAC.2